MAIHRPDLSLFVFVILFFCLSSSALQAQLNGTQQNGQVYRWDIVNAFSPAGQINAGGSASAAAADGSKITVTGSGTLIVDQPPNLPQLNIGPRALGSGNWTTRDAKGAVTGSGTYQVTGLVAFSLPPGSPNPPVDNIGIGTDRRPGLAILQVQYSDGDRGILTVSCHLVGTPDTVFEGISATKGYVAFTTPDAPVPNVDGNRTLFHILH